MVQHFRRPSGVLSLTLPQNCHRRYFRVLRWVLPLDGQALGANDCHQPIAPEPHQEGRRNNSRDKGGRQSGLESDQAPRQDWGRSQQQIGEQMGHQKWVPNQVKHNYLRTNFCWCPLHLQPWLRDYHPNPLRLRLRNRVYRSQWKPPENIQEGPSQTNQVCGRFLGAVGNRGLRYCRNGRPPNC